MTQNDYNAHEALKKSLDENTKLLKENNHLLRKIHRYHVIGAWVKVLWLMILIGLPFALYFYVLEPYFEALGSSYATFEAGIQEIPGLKQFELFFEEYQKSQSQN